MEEKNRYPVTTTNWELPSTQAIHDDVKSVVSGSLSRRERRFIQVAWLSLAVSVLCLVAAGFLKEKASPLTQSMSEGAALIGFVLPVATIFIALIWLASLLFSRLRNPGHAIDFAEQVRERVALRYANFEREDLEDRIDAISRFNRRLDHAFVALRNTIVAGSAVGAAAQYLIPELGVSSASKSALADAREMLDVLGQGWLALIAAVAILELMRARERRDFEDVVGVLSRARVLSVRRKCDSGAALELES